MTAIEQKDQIRIDISNHSLFTKLDVVKQKLITSDVYIHWFYGIKDLAIRDRGRTKELIKNHTYVPSVFKPIYLDIL